MPRRRGGEDGADDRGTAPSAPGRVPAGRAGDAPWRQVLALLPWGVGLTDAGGRLTYANPAMVELGGGRSLLGTPWYELFEPGVELAALERARSWSAAEARAAYGRPPVPGRLRSPGGPVEVGVHVIPLPAEGGGGAGGWCIACWPPDWSQGLRVAEGAVAALSHDLRTPLTTIRGLADLMLAEPDVPADPRSRRYTRMIRDNVEALNELIDRVVAVHRFRTGRLPGAPQPVDVDDLLAHVWPGCAVQAARRNVELQLVRSSPLPPTAACPETLRLVVTSLLANAIGAAGGTVTVAVEPGGPSSGGDAGGIVFRATGLPAVDAGVLAAAGADARRRIYGWAAGDGMGDQGELSALGMLVVATEALQGTVTAEVGSGGAGLVVTLPAR